MNFKLKENNTNIKIELVAGLTMFFSVFYMLLLTSNLLGDLGFNSAIVLIVTAFSSFISQLIIGFKVKRPFIIGPALGVCTVFTYSLVIGLGFSLNLALFAVNIGSILLILISVTDLLDFILEAIPKSVEKGINIGLGLLIILISLEFSGIIAHNGFIFTLGEFKTITVLLFVIGLLLTLFLMKKNIKSSILIGILVVYLLSIFSQFFGYYNGETFISGNIINLNLLNQLSSMKLYFPVFDDFKSVKNIIWLIVSVLIFLFIVITNTLGSKIAVLNLQSDEDEDIDLKDLLVPLGIGSLFGSFFGSVSQTAFIQSSIGSISGGKTGLSSVFAAICFLLTIFFSPLFILIPKFAIAPGMFVTGFLMLEPIKKIDFADLSESIPTFITFLITALSYSLSDGIIFGIIFYVLIKVFSGKKDDLNINVLVLFVFLVVILIITKFFI